MSRLDIFREAVKAKIAYWDASRALEKELGLEEVMDSDDNYIQEQISNYASGCDDTDWIGEEQLAEFVEGLGL